MAEQFLRIGGTDGEKSRPLKMDEEGSLVVNASGIEREVIKVTFGGADILEVTEQTNYTSDSIDIMKYKSIDIFVRNRVDAFGFPTEASFLTSVGDFSKNITRYYDWNTDDWTNAGVPTRYSPSTIQVLSTHPNFYWVKNSMSEDISIRISPQGPLREGPHYFQAWLVGELHV